MGLSPRQVYRSSYRIGNQQVLKGLHLLWCFDRLRKEFKVALTSKLMAQDMRLHTYKMSS